MKKKFTLLFVALIAVAAFAATTWKVAGDTPVAAEAALDDDGDAPVLGGDLAEIINGFIAANPDEEFYEFNLPAGASYTLSAPIVTGKSISIKGDAASPATIDASALKGDNAIIKMADVADKTVLGEIAFANLNMKIATRLFYANKQKYWVKELSIDNCVIAVDGTFKKSIIDCNGGGNVSHLLVNKSTIYANPKVGQNGGFFSSQSSQKPTEFGDNETQTFEITNSTLYNITNGNDMCTLREKDKDYMTFIFKSNIIVNCGKNKQFFKGFAGASDAKKATWEVDKNTIFWGGVDVSKDETIKGTNEEVKNCLTSDPGFADVENGDFTLDMNSDQAKYKTGDPRWILDASEYINLKLASGSDIGKELSVYNSESPKGVTLTLEKDGKYTSSLPIFISCPLTINGAEGVEIDASANEAPFINMKPLPVADLNEFGAYEISAIIIKDVKLTGVKNRLIYADTQNYLFDKIAVENSVIGIDGATPRTIFDFYCGGNFKELSILNSTLYADPSNSQRGGLLSTQSSKSIIEMGGESQKVSIKNSTLFNIAKGMTPVLLQRHSQNYLTFELLNNVIVNSGELGKFVIGLNEGVASDACTWNVKDNAFSFDGVNTCLLEEYTNIVSGQVKFADATKGDFTLSVLSNAFELKLGDPRWLIPGEGSVALTVESGQDIAAALATASEGKTPKEILINLVSGGQYTISKGIETAGDLVIKTDGQGQAVIDGSLLETPFIKLATIPAVETVSGRAANANGFEVIDQITVNNVKITGLKYQFFYANKQKYLIKSLDVYGSIIGVDGTNKKTIFDFNGGGLTEDLTISYSTLYAIPSNETNGGFYSTQSGSKLSEAGAERTEISILNSTLYNISNGKTTSTLRENSQAGQTYVVKGSIIANCGKEGQFLAGLNGGQKGKETNFNIYDNNITFGGVDVSEIEATKIAGNIGDPVVADAAFKDAENADFTLGLFSKQTNASVGDPRWIPKDIKIAPASGDISAALDEAIGNRIVRNINIELTPGAAYTISKSIEAPASIYITGSATIDASALDGPMITTPAETPAEWITADFGLWGPTVKGLKKALYASATKNYHYGAFAIWECIIEVAGDATTFDFTKGSVAETFAIVSSTFYAPTATTKSFYSSQGGQKATEFDENIKQQFFFGANTMYNLAPGKNFFSHRQSNQKWLEYVVNNNLFVNCGKSGQVIKGMNGGQGGANPRWSISENAFNFNGQDTSADETTGDSDEPVKDSVAGVMEFNDVEAPDFGGTFTLAAGAEVPEGLGHHIWEITFTEATGVKTVKTSETVDLENATIYNLNGQRVEKAQKGLYIINGKKVVIK